MSKEILEISENKYSYIFPNKEIISFHKEVLPEFSSEFKYTILQIIFIKNKFLFVKKKHGYFAIPGGGSELKNNNQAMIRSALDNAGSSSLMTSKIMDLIAKFKSHLRVNITREVLEEVGLLIPRPKYFGHQKKDDWQDEITFLSTDAFYFDQLKNLKPLEDLNSLSSKGFAPLDGSISKKEPFVIFGVEEVIKNINNFVYTHQVVLANFLLTLVNTEASVYYNYSMLKSVSRG